MNRLGISKKYLQFFVNNNTERWVILQGGRRSGKSFAVHKWLWLKASGMPKTIGIVAASFPALQLAMNDFQNATGLTVTGNALLGYSCLLDNGSRFLFRSFDEPTKVQGSTFDIVYLEEALNIPEQVISVLSMSVREQIYAAYNPTKKSGLDKYIAKDGHNYLKTTFRDNEYLSEAQIQEFEFIKKKAMLPTASILDKYNYTVYYLGDFGAMSGKVFKLIYSITDEEYLNIDSPELFGLDFGFTTNEQSDATAFVGIKIRDNCLYAKEYIYSTHLASDRELALRMAEIGIDVNTPIVADWGGLGKTRIHNLVTAFDYQWEEEGIRDGFSIQNAVKGRVIEGLQRMNQFDKIFVTESSENMRYEFDNYELNAEGRPKNGAVDHSIDAVRYAVNSYHINFY